MSARRPPEVRSRKEGPFPYRRIVLVSNRLPFRMEPAGGRTRLRPTVGGLVSGVSGFLRYLETAPGRAVDSLWIGWPGATAGPAARARFRRTALRERSCVPVFLSAREQERFYDGFSNRTLWPLFHYFPSLAAVDQRGWDAYRGVNERFADAVASVLRPGDAIWVHDYHLMLLPKMLRERAPGSPIAFFLHVPFPAFEVFRVIPHDWGSALIEGVLGADVAGFHTYDYARHFLRAAERLLGLGHRHGEVALPDRPVRVEAFPIGVDFPFLDGVSRDPVALAQREALAPDLRGSRTILSVDRLDYSKGLLNRFEAFERFLEAHPKWQGRVTLLAIVVPSRTGVESYRAMKVRIEEAVGRINGRFGRLGWTPVAYQYRAYPFPALAALYTLCPVALVTPLRDGMNLIAKEYLAARSDETGVLILSDTAGAAREMGEALIVNPYHVDSIVGAIRQALEMPEEEQRRRNRAMRDRLRRYDIVRWGKDQFQQLAVVRGAVEALRARSLTPARRAEMIRQFRNARRRMLLLDYDGTLVPLAPTPPEALPSAEVLRLLKAFARDPRTEIAILSGRERKTLEEWLEGIPLFLVAEHGAWSRDRSGTWRASRPIAREWKGHVRAVMEVFADRLPGSFLEAKEFSLAWHYRGSDPELGPVRARELAEALKDIEEKSDLQVLMGRKVVEVRGMGANKGTAALRWLDKRPAGFVLAAGDDATDEDLFGALPSSAWSLRVGPGESRARYSVAGPADLLAILGELRRASSPRRSGPRRAKARRDA